MSAPQRPGPATVSTDDVLVAWSMTGMSVEDLWVRYLATGGGNSLSAVAGRLVGDRSWPAVQELALVVTLNEALVELGLPAGARHPVLEGPRAADGLRRVPGR